MPITLVYGMRQSTGKAPIVLGYAIYPDKIIPRIIHGIKAIPKQKT
ncbi:unnamed protein product [marine sediment metagenome]|uniref:Uncharacterized protein n=1 Tax=marine sediment metagenome TaxID=412755 RepID=X1RND3_9ZZZZ